ncbi:MAG: PAS domain-containing sensor histidine kinase [Actinophytocola sp.]|uniref:PAS domain-containing sensor histidine kinase n=1 Tax=Actinophytocola sp. TaxID=1872138 RepID=UPI003D6AB1C4
MPDPTPSTDADFRLFVQGVSDYAIFMLDPSGHITSWNTGAERIKGYRPDEIIGQHFSVFYPDEDKTDGKPARELRTAVAEGRVEDEGWRVRKDGTRFWANVVITALYGDGGELRGFGKVTRDLTERRTAEHALWESEERFRMLVQNVVDYAIFMLDPSGRIMSWNAGAERIKGYLPDEIIGQHFSVFYPDEDNLAGKPAGELQAAVAEGRVQDEGWRLRKDGTRFWANVTITALYGDSGELRGFGKVTRDLTERRTAEQILDERRRLLRHLVHAQELERRRIAWDVHDDSIQSMVAVGMRLQLLAGRLPEEYRQTLIQLDEAVRGTITRLRTLVFQLRPTAIDRHGLVSALTDYLRDVVTGWGLAPTLHHDELAEEPPTETAITIFRICQEALTNVRKHAKAGSADIHLSTVEHGTHVRVVDDGIGYSREQTEAQPLEHFGLIEMRERAETASGWWTITGAPGDGTTVEFWLPTIIRPEVTP